MITIEEVKAARELLFRFNQIPLMELKLIENGQELKNLPIEGDALFICENCEWEGDKSEICEIDTFGNYDRCPECGLVVKNKFLIEWKCTGLNNTDLVHNDVYKTGFGDLLF